jgi:hypothetical protein
VADSECWHLAAQLVRRHPDTLWVTAPADEPYSWPYDLMVHVVRLATPGQHPALSFNRAGSILGISWFGDGKDPHGPDLRWQAALYQDDPRDWLVQIERAAG